MEKAGIKERGAVNTLGHTAATGLLNVLNNTAYAACDLWCLDRPG